MVNHILPLLILGMSLVNFPLTTPSYERDPEFRIEYFFSYLLSSTLWVMILLILFKKWMYT